MLKFKGIKAQKKNFPEAHIVVFNRHVNPKNSNDFFYRDIENQFNGKAYSWQELQEKFNIISGTKEHNQFVQSNIINNY